MTRLVTGGRAVIVPGPREIHVVVLGADGYRALCGGRAAHTAVKARRWCETCRSSAAAITRLSNGVAS